ncbi:Sensor protein VraS (plasmid) [Variovorax sp. PBL-E5]|nr:Sensor protein VraS [Variovorax sp. PBL-E5]
MLPQAGCQVMRRMARACSILMLCALMALPGFTPAFAATDDGIITLEAAHARLEPRGAAPREGEVDLARRWDRDFPGLGGRATYDVALPPRVGSEPMALLFSRVGNQVHVLVNGTTVQRWGDLGDPVYDASKTMRMVTLPAALLHADRPNALRVEVTIQPQRLGGLSVLRYGPREAIEDLYDAQILWRDLAMLLFAAGLIGMGALTALLWWRQRDPFYGWFSLSAFLGVTRVIDRSWADLPLPWPLLGAVAAICYSAHIALMCRFVLMALGPVPRGMQRAIDGVMAAAAILDILAFALHLPLLMTLGLVLLPILGLATLAAITRVAWVRHSTKAWVLAAAIAGAMATGVYDIVMIRIAGASGLRNTYSQHALFAFVLLMAWFIAERYSRSVANYHALNADLARRVEERERQLHEAFDSLREQQHHQSVSNERQRIMREIHDGVGSQLVGLLNMVTQKGADAAALKDQVQLALDEMRMAVDSLQPAHDDLSTLLATLRYRLQSRLQAAGVAVVWDVAELPELQQLPPHVVLHVQRILLEAFTNVLKHARASQVTVQVRWRDEDAPRVLLRIADNGIGLRTDEGASEAQIHGRGLDNMRARAAAIGAVFRLEPSAGGGTCVALEWRVERRRTRADTAG